MYISELRITNFRQFSNAEPNFSVRFHKGVTALVGENDSGKSAVIDAIRHVLSTRDMEFLWLQPEDFHILETGQQATEISICCKLSGLSIGEKGSFVEYLTYEDQEVSLYVHWTARRLSDKPGSRRWVDISVRSGPEGKGPALDTPVRQLLAAAYLKPLRDAEREMSPGRASRLSQILAHFSEILSGTPFDINAPPAEGTQVARLSLVGLSDYLRHLVNKHPGVSGAEGSINRDYLSALHLSGEKLHGRISFAEGGNEPARLRQILEKLELNLLEGPAGMPKGNYGLGSNNLLFMACELLLLGKEPEGFPLLLIEEPEAHLHPQRQLRLMEFLLLAASEIQDQSHRQVQVIVTTHSPNLASKIPLENMVLLQGQRAFSLAERETKLSKGDYRFLERFLDVTKANLFFARAVMIVEGDAEAILIPALAKLIGKDLTEHGVSIVNVGGTGLRRYSRILQRRMPSNGTLSIPVACLTDMDVMPDCAPEILELVTGNDDPKWSNSRRKWKVKRDFGTDEAQQGLSLELRRSKLCDGDGQTVQTFVSDHWTLEYDLAFSGLAEDVFLAASLAANDNPLNENRRTKLEIGVHATTAFASLRAAAGADKAALCSRVYENFSSGRASKAVAAQYLAEILSDKVERNELSAAALLPAIPQYLRCAIELVTSPIVVTTSVLSSENPNA